MIKQQCLFGTLLKTKFQAGIFCFLNPRACLKNHSYNLHAPICGIFCLHSVDVARYAALIQAKSPTNCNAHLAESIFHSIRHCQNHRSIILPICGLGASVGCERMERTFNTPRRKSQMGRTVVCSLLGRQLKKIKLFI